ncbi:DsbC family protein [Curvibacter sp. APW13]|uniref:DsbC family protein n=1 Tax=Curvibacter sp. APW13 TaxID=3077236 RepID=UPI0028DF3CA9|nr:DsbC family protein [Curvibacter sp. APW13]MDT8989721.1 DsbC family protein [Curvibacter sp. APW13]
MKFLPALAAAAALYACAAVASAQDAQIKKNIDTHLPQLQGVQEVRKTPIPGIFEIRVQDSEIYYTDAKGEFLIQGQVYDLKNKRNLTKEREDKLTAVNWDSLPVKDAITFTRGNGARKLAVFADPNCGYCKKFERDLLKVDNITVHVFQIGILAPDSKTKNRAIWCARDKGQAWLDWMVKGAQPAEAAAMCDSSAVTRNEAFAKKNKINSTPTLLFEDGSRTAGAIPMEELEQQFASIKK